jgi:hypothetical protein
VRRIRFVKKKLVWARGIQFSAAVALLAVAVLFHPGSVNAQSMEPRAYSNAPVGMTREQDPIYSLQGHLIYNFPSGIWAALNATCYTGGRSSIDGVQGDDLQSNWRLGSTLTLPLNIKNSLKFFASTGVITRTGGNFDLLGIAWQYRWGGGL